MIGDSTGALDETKGSSYFDVGVAHLHQRLANLGRSHDGPPIARLVVQQQQQQHDNDSDDSDDDQQFIIRKSRNDDDDQWQVALDDESTVEEYQQQWHLGRRRRCLERMDFGKKSKE